MNLYVVRWGPTTADYAYFSVKAEDVDTAMQKFFRGWQLRRNPDPKYDLRWFCVEKWRNEDEMKGFERALEGKTFSNAHEYGAFLCEFKEGLA